MSLQLLKITEVRESKTNTRGKNFEGKAFEELVASIKEKGVLMPILVRMTSESRSGSVWEVVAGNRRLRVAKKSGLEEIPVQTVEMTDIEAQEAQIVENLQRQDIHPLEEGEAYRKLIEESKYEISAVAAKVGKTESYIKQRLFLTNLENKPAEAYRSGKINDGHAVLIAKLSPLDQVIALKEKLDRNWMSVKDLERWIKDNIYSTLDFQPWLKSPELMEAVGKCQECEPSRASLFGPVKEGACTDLKCWNRKMQNYINYRAKKESLAKITKEYGTAPKGILGKDSYVMMSSKIKDHCEHARQAIIAHGEDAGMTVWICDSGECKTHKTDRAGYRENPAEIKARKIEALRAKKKTESDQKEFQEVIAKIKYPLRQKHLDALLDFAFYRCGVSFQLPAVKLLGAELVKKEKTSGWDEKKKVMKTDYEATIRAWAEKNGNEGKMQAIFAMMIPHPSSYGNEHFDKAVKKL